MFLLKSIIMAAASGLLSFGSPGGDIEKLWKEYRKAEEQDLPEKAAEKLSEIKKTAAGKGLSWDFYEASNLYVDVCSRRDWKSRDKLNEQKIEGFKAYGDPVILYHAGLGPDRENWNECKAFLDKWEKKLKAGNNVRFRDELPLPYMNHVVGKYIHNDYDYLLYSIIFGQKESRTDADAAGMKAAIVEGYPVDALYELYMTKADGTAYADYASKYEGKAVGTLAKLQALSMEMSRLNSSGNTTSEDYINLKKECQALIKEKKAYSGVEALVLSECNIAENLVKELESRKIEGEIKGNEVSVYLRNLPEVKLCIYKGTDRMTVSAKNAVPENKVFEQTLENGTGSCYLYDTLRTVLPELPDGRYLAVFSSGKRADEKRMYLERHSVAVSMTQSADGWMIYAAERKNGKPIEKILLEVMDNDDKAVISKEIALDGATLLDDEIQKELAGGAYGRRRLHCSCTDSNGRYRDSDMIRIYNSSYDHGSDYIMQTLILTDRSAYRPGETISFKAILYEDFRNGRMATASAGQDVEVLLKDAEDRQVEVRRLSNNDFGAVAGSFAVPHDARNGNWTIELRCNGRSLNGRWLTVDEFRLPEFTANFINDRQKHFPGETIDVKGVVTSYAGNSLSDAKVEYTIESWHGREKKGSLELEKDGSFNIPLHTGNEDNNYTVTVKITDGAGQSLEFSKWLYVSDGFHLSAELKNVAEGSFESDNENGIIDSGKAVLLAEIKDGNWAALDGNIEWTLTQDGKTISKGSCESGREFSLSLEGLDSGLYTVVFSKEYDHINGRTGAKVSDGQKLDILKIKDDETVLDAEVENMFKVCGNGNEAGLMIGAGKGQVWANVMLFDMDGHILYNGKTSLKGEKGKTGSIVKWTKEYAQGWSDNVLLKVEYFRNGHYRTFEHEYNRATAGYGKLLSIDTVTDAFRPGTEYIIKVSSEKETEILAAVFDRSTEDIRPNPWNRILPQTRGIYLNGRHDSGCDFDAGDRYAIPFHLAGRLYGAAAGVNVSMPMAKSSDMLFEEEAMMDSTPAGYMESAEDVGGNMTEISPAKFRNDFRSTLLFEPFFRTSEDGSVEIRFRTSDKLGTYVLSLFAHDRDFHNAVLRQEFVVSKTVAITVHEPSLLYSGDRYSFRPSVSNNSEKTVEGRLNMFVYDAADEKGRTKKNLLIAQSRPLKLAAGESSAESFEISVPEAEKMVSYAGGKGQLIVEAVFQTHSGESAVVQDALRAAIPVYADKQIITESHSAVYRPGMDKVRLIEDLGGEFVNTTRFGAVEKERNIRQMLEEVLDGKAEVQSENLLDLSEALYVRMVRGKGETSEIVKRILECKRSDGGFSWFAGMESSPVLTTVLLERLALLRRAGLLPEGSDWEKICEDAVRYIDREFFRIRDGYRWYSGISTGQYVYVRSFFPSVGVDRAVVKGNKKLAGSVKDYVFATKIRNSRKEDSDAMKGQILEKARRAASLMNLLSAESGDFAESLGIGRRKIKSTLSKDISSLKEYAVSHKSGGIYYPNAVMPFRALLESEAYAHSILCDLMDAWDKWNGGDARAAEIADGIRLWLMVQKENQKWTAGFEYVNAVNSVLNASGQMLGTSVISLSKTYEKPFEEIKEAGNGFRIEKEFYTATDSGLRQISAGETVSVGDRITVRYKIYSDENRSLVHIRMPYNACLRPVRQLSGHYGAGLRNWRINAALNGFSTYWISPQGYREVREAATDYWFDVYPEEDTVIEDEFYVSQAGVFTAPVCTIESLYAPHYRANSAYGGSLTVK